MTFQAVPITYENEANHRRLLAEASNRHNQAKFNCTIEFTVDANADTTELNDARITAYSVLCFMPVTSTAATELATLYVPETTMKSGQAIINHSNSAVTDRSYRVGIFG